MKRAGSGVCRSLTIFVALGSTALLAARAATSASRFDLLIVNGLVVDGMGGAPFRADLAVRNGHIVKVGSLANEPARQTLDAQGLIVAPGFIDAHTHLEEQIKAVSRRLAAENFVLQGVTTVITGNCGRSAPDIGELFRKLERLKLGVNVATLVGHNTIRQQVCGARPQPTPQQLAKMESLVRAALDAGALGFSTGLCYKPGLYASEDEVVALVRVAAQARAVYATHIRDEAAGGRKALQEAVQTAQLARVPKLHISHFKAAGRSEWGLAQARLEWVRRAIGSSIRFTTDMYPYTSISSTLDYFIPPEAFRLLGGPAAHRKQNLEKAVDATLTKLHLDGWADYSNVRVAFSAIHKGWIGRAIPDIVRSEQGSATPSDQAHWILKHQAGEDVQVIAEEMSEQDVRQLIRAREMCFGSDSSIHYRGVGRPHPRGAGTFSRIFGEYVRDLKLITLEEAVRRASGLPAEIFDLPERGLIREGFWADLVLFDPARIRDRATPEDPWRSPDGIAYVIENGVVVARQGKITGALPGRPVRRQARRLQ